MTLFKNLLANEDGATAIEYGLIAALDRRCRHHRHGRAGQLAVEHL